jgi:hypothetical protein
MKEFCSVDCGYALSRHKQRQKWAREAREYRKAEKASKAKITDQEGPAKSARMAVHGFIAVRDMDKPCIVHGHNCQNADAGFDAGHFRSVGSAPELRFNTWNIHKQCRLSNRGAHNRKRYRASVDRLYEAGLVERIGQERVDWLKGPHKPNQYRAKDFERIARIFRKRTRIYKKIKGIS